MKSTRIKERTSFEFQWLKLDFTVTQMTIQNKETGPLEYEVELEVRDMAHLQRNVEL